MCGWVGGWKGEREGEETALINNRPMLRVALIRSNASPSPTPDATSARWKTLWERHPPSPY